MDDPVYVLHVKKGFEDREQSIRRQFAALQTHFEWVLEFDIPEIDAGILDRYRNPQDHLRIEEISCCLKHLSAWGRIAHSEAEGGLILEDDALLDTRRFGRLLDLAIAEFKRLHAGTGCICLGDGCAMHVPWTRKKRGTYLYRAGQMRAADSYWISRQTAALLHRRVEANGFTLPADHLITAMLKELEVPLFWLEPTIVTQGSHCGVFNSIIQLNDIGFINKKYEFLIKKIRRKYIYPLLGIDPRYK